MLSIVKATVMTKPTKKKPSQTGIRYMLPVYVYVEVTNEEFVASQAVLIVSSRPEFTLKSNENGRDSTLNVSGMDGLWYSLRRSTRARTINDRSIIERTTYRVNSITPDMHAQYFC